MFARRVLFPPNRVVRTRVSTMAGYHSSDYLSDMSSTCWSLVLKLNHDGEPAREAQTQLLRRYGPAIRRYLMAALRNPTDVDEVFQDLSFKLARGDFRSADPNRGRFRKFLKTALYNLIIDFQRKKKRLPRQLPEVFPEPADDVETIPFESDAQFHAIWRDGLMDHAWSGLAEYERLKGKPLFTLLKYRIDNPTVRSREMAVIFSSEIGKDVDDNWIRKRLFEARDKFTDLLLDGVEQSLEHPTYHNVEQELIDLGLLKFCQDALKRRMDSKVPRT